MPTPTPVVPTPITPTSPSNSTLTMSVSGMLPVSGEPTGAFSGPHLIEEQTLHIDYVRVPNMKEDPSGTFLSLSAPAMGWRVDSTYLQVRVGATYTRTKSYDFFATSGWQQNQSFVYNPVSADAFGTTYGSVGNAALGPAGSVDTSTNYYSRRPWNDAVDSSAYEHADGTLHYYQSVGSGNAETHYFADGMSDWGDFTKTTPWSNKGPTWTSDYFKNSRGGEYTYWFNGTYATSLESSLSIQNFIDDMADRLSNPFSSGGFYGIGENFVIDEYGTTVSYYQPKRTERVPNYSKNRHQWNTQTGN